MPLDIFKDAVTDPHLSIFVLLFLITFLIQLIFYGLIFPTLIIFELKTNDLLSRGQKAFWLISILLTWTFAAVSYGVFVSEKKNIKTMVYIFFLTCIIQASFLLYLFFNCRQPL